MERAVEVDVYALVDGPTRAASQRENSMLEVHAHGLQHADG